MYELKEERASSIVLIADGYRSTNPFTRTNPFYRAETETQGRFLTFPRTHSWEGTDLGLNSGQSDLKSTLRIP